MGPSHFLLYFCNLLRQRDDPLARSEAPSHRQPSPGAARPLSPSPGAPSLQPCSTSSWIPGAPSGAALPKQSPGTSLTWLPGGATQHLPLGVPSIQHGLALWETLRGLLLPLRLGPEGSADPCCLSRLPRICANTGMSHGQGEDRGKCAARMHHGSFHGRGMETVSYQCGNNRCPPQPSPFISFQETVQTGFIDPFETNMVWS